MTSTMTNQDSISPISQAYPSPSLSPETSFRPTMDRMDNDLSTRRSSVKSLMSSANPPASPLDALVMALEATAEEMAMNGAPRSTALENVEDEDPDATVPSSPTFFMKKSSGLSLHQLPTLLLPESVASSSSEVSSTGAGLTPSTHPDHDHPDHDYPDHRRKMSTSSQGSVSSTNSSSERKIYACTVGNCDKKFTQVAHRRIHER